MRKGQRKLKHWIEECERPKLGKVTEELVVEGKISEKVDKLGCVEKMKKEAALD